MIPYLSVLRTQNRADMSQQRITSKCLKSDVHKNKRLACAFTACSIFSCSFSCILVLKAAFLITGIFARREPVRKRHYPHSSSFWHCIQYTGFLIAWPAVVPLLAKQPAGVQDQPKEMVTKEEKIDQGQGITLFPTINIGNSSRSFTRRICLWNLQTSSKLDLSVTEKTSKKPSPDRMYCSRMALNSS